MLNMKCYYIPDNYTLVANEKDLYKDIIDNNAFGFFANLFLLECSEDSYIGKVKFASISNKRQKEQFAIYFRRFHCKYNKQNTLKIRNILSIDNGRTNLMPGKSVAKISEHSAMNMISMKTVPLLEAEVHATRAGSVQ